MLILVGVITSLFVIAAVRLALPAVKRRRITSELRGDWWPAFEREFRTYASHSWVQAREAEQSS